MSSVNKVILVGNLGQDPEIRDAGGGKVCGLRLATNEKWTDRDGNRQERTEWHSVSVWGKQAEICGEYLTKGRKVYLEGRIQSREYTDREGNQRTATEIVASSVVFLSGGDEASGRAQGGRQGGQREQGGQRQQARPDYSTNSNGGGWGNGGSNGGQRQQAPSHNNGPIPF